MRNPQGVVAQRIQEIGEAQVCTSIIVTAELRYGAAKKKSARLTAQLNAVLAGLEVLPFAEPADAVYGILRASLEESGKPIEANDLLIAAQAVALKHVLVTDNEREFSRASTISSMRIGHVSEILRTHLGSLRSLLPFVVAVAC